MAHATFKATLKEEKRSDGTRAVRIRITRNRQHAYYTLGIYLKGEPKKKDARKGDWNPDGDFIKANWVRSSHHDHGQYNERIRNAIKGLDAYAAKHPSYTPLEIKQGYVEELTRKDAAETPRVGFIAFFKEWIRRKDTTGQHGTSTVYESTLYYLEQFWGDRPDTHEELRPAVISSFIQHLRTVKLRNNKTGYKASTINTAFRTYRTVFKNAVLEGWLPPMPNPFDLPLLTEEEKAVQYPSVEELLSLMGLEGLSDVQRHARNVLLMQYFLNGARASEVLTLQWSDLLDDRVDYQPKKRSKRRKSIARHAGVEWVLAQYEVTGRYIFPYLDVRFEELPGRDRVRLIQNTISPINKALARVGKKAGITAKLTTHAQRHAFAEKVWQLTKDPRKVQEMVGHSSFQTTEQYLAKLQLREKDDINETLYGGIGKTPGKQ